MLYVEPIYLKSSGERAFPQMQRVLLNFGDKVAFATDVRAGIAQLLGQAAPAPPPNANNPPPPAPGSNALAEAASRLNTAIENLKKAQQSSDFEAYGKALAELDAAVKAFQAAQAAAANAQTSTGTPSPSPSPTSSPSG
jgi:uncharacterized membrane protein (UPF0182 family)